MIQCKLDLTQAIEGGRVITFEKTKAIGQGGKQTITAGLNKLAVPNSRERYAVHRYGYRVPPSEASLFFSSAAETAQWLIDFMGRDIINEKLRQQGIVKRYRF